VLAVGGADGGVRLFLCDTSELTSGSDESDEREELLESTSTRKSVDVEACATLAGHADWVRDLAFAADDDAEVPPRGGGKKTPGLLLASASQDRTARVWRVRVAYAAADDGSAAVPAYARLARPPPPPSALLGGAARVAADLEAVLQGHEDWVMSVAWRPDAAKAFSPDVREGDDGSHAPKSSESSQLSLLTASADRSLIHWTPVSEPTAPRGGGVAGPESRVWMASESVGDAASSCLGFYGAMFDARARRVLAHAHGGALHAWRRAGSKAAGGDERWAPAPASAGHAGEVTSLSWDAAGRFLLSGSVDMTGARARELGEPRGRDLFERFAGRAQAGHADAGRADHGVARDRAPADPRPRRDVRGGAPPGGVDAEAIGGGEEKADAKTDAATLAGGSVVFVSGADEKTLRVFDAPGTFLGTLARSLPRSDRAGRRALEAARERAADASGGAELPQLGLSNKALRAPEAPPEPVPETPSAEPAERAERVGASGAGGDGGEEGSASSFSFASFAGDHGFGVDPDPTNSLLPPESAPTKSAARRRRDGVIEGERRQDVIMLTPERPSEGARPADADAPLGDDDTTPVVKARSGAADAAGVSSDAPPRPDSSFVRAETPKRPKRSGDSAAKATAEPAAGERGGDAHANGESARDGDTFGSVTPAVLSRPPAEEALASATLWPEARKLYGHGDDVSCVAAHPSGALVASACEARSASAASIWVWDASKDWRPLGKLAGATLTVVALHFASPARAATPAGAAGARPAFSAPLPLRRAPRRRAPAPRSAPRSWRRRGTGTSPSTCPRSLP
jgi:WD40 repeat protein